jgi:hypothetical protein
MRGQEMVQRIEPRQRSGTSDPWSLRRAVQDSSWVIACAVLAGCQTWLDVEEQQCETDRDCVGLLGRSYICTEEQVCADAEDTSSPLADAGAASELPANWACLSEPPRRVAPVAGRTVQIRFAVTDFVELTVPEGLVAKACNPTDIRCDRPAVDNVTPDEEGFLEFDLPHGFWGYTQLSAPTYVDSLSYSNRPFITDAMPDGPTLLTPAALREIAEGGGEQIDMDRGIAILTVFDCDDNAAPGVRFEQEDEANVEPPFYFEGTLPDRERMTTTVSTLLTRSMKPQAAGGFSHIEPGYVSMVAVHEQSGLTVGRITVQIRAFTMTFAEIHAGY